MLSSLDNTTQNFRWFIHLSSYKVFIVYLPIGLSPRKCWKINLLCHGSNWLHWSISVCSQHNTQTSPRRRRVCIFYQDVLEQSFFAPLCHTRTLVCPIFVMSHLQPLKKIRRKTMTSSQCHAWCWLHVEDFLLFLLPLTKTRHLVNEGWVNSSAWEYKTF